VAKGEPLDQARQRRHHNRKHHLLWLMAQHACRRQRPRDPAVWRSWLDWAQDAKELDEVMAALRRQENFRREDSQWPERLVARLNSALKAREAREEGFS
jgi:hypothetical protein